MPGQGNQGRRNILTHTLGGRYEKYFIINDCVGILGGVEHRSDFGDLRRFNTTRRIATATTRDIEYEQHNSSFYALVDYKPAEWIKFTAGGRYDHFFFDVGEKLGMLASSNSNEGELSPTVGVALSPDDRFTFFANYAEGLRAPSVAEELPTNPNLGVSEQRSYEVGATFNSDRWHLLMNLYHSELDGEILSAPTGAAIQNLDKSRRIGADLEARYDAYDNGQLNIGLLSSASYIDVKLIGARSGAVPGVPEYEVGGGFEMEYRGHGGSIIGFRADYEFIGPSDLNPAGTFRTGTYHRLSGKLSYRRSESDGLAFHLSAIAYPGGRLDESVFLLGDVPAVSAQAPIAVQAGVSMTF